MCIPYAKLLSKKLEPSHAHSQQSHARTPKINGLVMLMMSAREKVREVRNLKDR